MTTKIKFRKMWLIATACATLIFSTSCKDDDKPSPTPVNESKDILIASSIASTDGMSGTSFIQMIKDLTPASYSNKIARPFVFGIMPIVIDKSIYELPIMSSIDVVNKYEQDSEGNLQKVGSLSLEAKSGAAQMVQLNDTKAYISLWMRGKILIVNPKTMTKTGEIDVTQYGVGDKNPDPAGMVIRDGLLYVALEQVVGGYFPAPDRPYADVLIIDTKTDKPIKMITDKTSQFSFPARPIDQKSIFIDEKGDIYITCVGAFGALPNHKMGILRIKKGETEFDKSYSFSLSDATIEGEANKASWILYSQYAGSGKLYSLLYIPAYIKDPKKPNYLSDRTTLAVEIDLNAKTVKKLPDLPRGNSYGSIGIYNGKIIVGIASDNSQGYHIYDPATGKGTKEAVIKIVGSPSCFRHFGEKW